MVWMESEGGRRAKKGVARPIAPQCVHMPLDGARVNLVELMELEFMARKLNLWLRRQSSNRREQNPGSEGIGQRQSTFNAPLNASKLFAIPSHWQVQPEIPQFSEFGKTFSG